MPKYAVAVPGGHSRLFVFGSDVDDPEDSQGGDSALQEGEVFDHSRLVWSDGQWLKFAMHGLFQYVQREHVVLVPDTFERRPEEPYRRPLRGAMITRRMGIALYLHYDEVTGTRWNVGAGRRGWFFVGIDTPEAYFNFTSKKATLQALNQYLSVRNWTPEEGWHVRQQPETA